MKVPLAFSIAALCSFAGNGCSRFRSASGPSASGTESVQSADTFLGRDRNGAFQVYVDALSDAHVISTLGIARLGTTWEAQLERSRTRFIHATSTQDSYYALLSLHRSLRDAHSRLEVPDSMAAALGKPVRLPFKVRLGKSGNDGAPRFFVSESEMHSKIPVGAAVTKIDGKSVAELRNELLEWHRNSSPDALNLELTRWMTFRDPFRHPAPAAGIEATVAFENEAGESGESKLSWAEASRPPDLNGLCGPLGVSNDEYASFAPALVGLNYCLFETRRDLFVLRYFGFMYDFEPDALNARAKVLNPELDPSVLERAQAQELQLADEEALRVFFAKQARPTDVLIDVRDNLGGSISASLLSIFAKNPFKVLSRSLKLSSTLKRDVTLMADSLSYADTFMADIVAKEIAEGKAHTREFPFYCQTPSCHLSERDVAIGPSMWKPRKVGVLSGPGCVSACDQFVAIMKDNAIATVLGRPSLGSHSPYRGNIALGLANGETFSIGVTTGRGLRPNGEPLEGNPALPDVLLDEAENTLAKALEQFEGVD